MRRGPVEDAGGSRGDWPCKARGHGRDHGREAGQMVSSSPTSMLPSKERGAVVKLGRNAGLLLRVL